MSIRNLVRAAHPDDFFQGGAEAIGFALARQGRPPGGVNVIVQMFSVGDN